MWWIYSKTEKNDKNDKSRNYGMMMYVILKEGRKYNDFFENQKIKVDKVQYVTRGVFKKFIQNPTTIPVGKVGFIKTNYWKYEKELRFVCFEPKNVEDIGRAPMRINFDSIESIYLFLDPNLENANSNSVRRLIKNETGITDIDFHVYKSEIRKIFNSTKEKNK